MLVSSCRAVAKAARQRHSVDISARAAFGSVHIGVSIDPHEADRLAAVAESVRYAGDSPDRDRVIATQDKRELFGFGDVVRLLWLTMRRYARFEEDILHASKPVGVFSCCDYGHVAEILDAIAENRASRSVTARRSADGPISTPRRPAPRSSGAPRMVIATDA